SRRVIARSAREWVTKAGSASTSCSCSTATWPTRSPRGRPSTGSAPPLSRRGCRPCPPTAWRGPAPASPPWRRSSAWSPTVSWPPIEKEEPHASHRPGHHEPSLRGHRRDPPRPRGARGAAPDAGRREGRENEKGEDRDHPAGRRRPRAVPGGVAGAGAGNLKTKGHKGLKGH